MKRNFEVYYLKIICKRTARQYKLIIIIRNSGRDELKVMDKKKSNKIYY